MPGCSCSCPRSWNWGSPMRSPTPATRPRRCSPRGTRWARCWRASSPATAVCRLHHVRDLVADPAAGLAVGLNVLPKTTNLSGYSHRVRRDSIQALLAKLAGRLVELGVVDGHDGFNLDFHAIRHHGEIRRWNATTCPNAPSRSPACCRVRPGPRLTGDGLRQRRCDQGRQGPRGDRVGRLVTAGHRRGSDPAGVRLAADHLPGPRRARCPRHHRAHPPPARPQDPATSQCPPASAWTKVRIDRAGRYRRPHLHDQTIRIPGASAPPCARSRSKTSAATSPPC